MQCASVTLLRQISVSPGPGRNFTQSHKEHKEAISITHSLLPAGQKSDKKNQGSVHIVQSLQAVHAVNTHFQCPVFRVRMKHKSSRIPEYRTFLKSVRDSRNRVSCSSKWEKSCPVTENLLTTFHRTSGCSEKASVSIIIISRSDLKD